MLAVKHALRKVPIVDSAARRNMSFFSASFLGDSFDVKWPAKRLLVEGPPGAYTTARTVNRNAVFQFDMHVQRMVDSSHGVHASQRTADENSDSQSPVTLPSWLSSADALRPVLQAESRTALDAFDAAHPQHAKDDLRVTYYVTWGEDMRNRVRAALEGGSELAEAPLLPPAAAVVSRTTPPAALAAEEAKHCALITHVCALPARPQPPVRLLVRGAPRANAGAKSSAWVKQRGGLEALLRSGDSPLEEVLLHTPTGGLLEGLSTNVAAVCGGGVVTPGEGVLLGTVREVLLEMAATAGIAVQLDAPPLSALAACTGVSVSSTSRLCLPGSTLEAPTALLRAADSDADDTPPTAADLARRSTAAWVRRALAASVSDTGAAAGASGGGSSEIGTGAVAPPPPDAELRHIFETAEPGVFHMPHPSGDGGAFVFAGAAPGSDAPALGAAQLAQLTAEQADTLPRMRYRLRQPSNAAEHAVLDMFTTQVPPSFRGAGMAGKLARGALDTTAALGARAKPSCSYLHATFVPRNLGYMDVVSDVTPDIQAAAEAALASVAGSPAPTDDAAGSTAAGNASALGTLHPSHVRMQRSMEHDEHVHVSFSLSPVSRLLEAMVMAQVASHSSKVR